MNHQNHNNTSDELRLTDDGLVLSDADTRQVHDLLDQLAEAERVGAPAGLADRVFEGSRAGLGPRIAARIGPEAPAPRMGLLTPLRAAAAVALAATVGVAILATGSERALVARAGPTSPPIEAYIDAWATNSYTLESDLSARVSALDAEMSALREDLTKGAPSYDPWSDEGAL